MINYIAIALIIFSVLQLRLLYNEHLIIQSYSPEEKIGSYQFHTYGTALVYMAIIAFSANQLYSQQMGGGNEWRPSTPFVSEGKPSGGGGQSGVPMMSVSTSAVVNSYYKSQLMGFLYKQG